MLDENYWTRTVNLVAFSLDVSKSRTAPSESVPSKYALLAVYSIHRLLHRFNGLDLNEARDYGVL